MDGCISSLDWLESTIFAAAQGGNEALKTLLNMQVSNQVFKHIYLSANRHETYHPEKIKLFDLWDAVIEKDIDFFVERIFHEPYIFAINNAQYLSDRDAATFRLKREISIIKYDITNVYKRIFQTVAPDSKIFQCAIRNIEVLVKFGRERGQAIPIRESLLYKVNVEDDPGLLIRLCSPRGEKLLPIEYIWDMSLESRKENISSCQYALRGFFYYHFVKNHANLRDFSRRNVQDYLIELFCHNPEVINELLSYGSLDLWANLLKFPQILTATQDYVKGQELIHPEKRKILSSAPISRANLM